MLHANTDSTAPYSLDDTSGANVPVELGTSPFAARGLSAEQRCPPGGCAGGRWGVVCGQHEDTRQAPVGEGGV